MTAVPVRSIRQAACAAALAAAAGAAGATTYSFTAALNGPSEFPPVASTATGSATVTFNDALFQVVVQESWSGLLGGPATASHIHCCNASPGTGTSAVFLGFSNFPNAASGNYVNTFTLLAADFTTLLSGTQAGRSYVNIHDATYTGGEIRGFLVSAVPEPSNVALMLVGLSAFGWRVARQARRTQGRAD